MNGYSVTGSATRASTGNAFIDRMMANAAAERIAEAERKAAKKAATQPEAVTRTVLTAEPSKSVSATFTATPPAANELAGEIQFGKDIAQPQTVVDASGLLASMKQARETSVPQPAVDLLGFFNGLLMEPDEEELLREHTLAVAKQEADSAEFADAPLVDLNKVQVTLTDTSWALFRVFASDFGRNAETEKAHRLATGKEYGRDGLRDVAGAFYGALCGHNSDGHPVRVCLGSMWWRATSARSKDVRVITEIVMEPTDKPDDPSSGVFNRFHVLRRKAVRPDLTATRDDIKLFDDHLLMSAGGCEATREYVLDWLAFMYQCPDYKPDAALAFVSPIKGTGKSWFIYPLKWVFGEGLVCFTGGDALYDGNDGPFIHKQITFVDELPDPSKARRGVDPAAKLKRIITSRVSTLRPMYAPATEMRTPAVVITCNEIDYLANVVEGRRLCIVYNPDAIRDAGYYNALFAWAGVDKPGPGMAKLAGYLKNRDISKFNPNAAPPFTVGKALANEAALSKEAQFFKTLFEEGHPLFVKDFGRVLDFGRQLETLCTPGQLKGLNLGSINLPKVFRELGWKLIGADGTYTTADKASRAWCWRNWEKWGDASTPRKERIDYMTGAAPLTVHNGGLSQ